MDPQQTSNGGFRPTDSVDSAVASSDPEMRNFGRSIQQKRGTLDPSQLDPAGFVEERPIPEWIKNRKHKGGSVRESRSAQGDPNLPPPPKPFSPVKTGGGGGGGRRAGAGGAAAAAAGRGEYGLEEVDHRNVRKTWRPRQQVAEEADRRARVAANRRPEPRRAFPGPIRQSAVPPAGAVAQYLRATDPGNKRLAATFRAMLAADEEAERRKAERRGGGGGKSLATAHQTSNVESLATFGAGGGDEGRAPAGVGGEEEEEEEDPLVAEARRAAAAAARREALLRDPDFKKLDQSELPIELFDSLECAARDRTPQEWLATKSEASVPYFLDGKWRWRRCRVLRYDEKARRFTVQFLPQGRVKDVKRLNVLFDRENKADWERRRAFAYAHRDEAKAYLRLDHFVACQPNEGVRAVRRAWLRGAHAKVADGLPRWAPFPDRDSAAGRLLRRLTADAIQDYTRAMKKAVLAHQLERDPAVRERYERLQLPPVPPRPPPPQYGKVAVPSYPFRYNRKRVRELHFSNKAEVLATFVWLHAAWDVVFAPLRFVDARVGQAAAAAAAGALDGGGGGGEGGEGGGEPAAGAAGGGAWAPGATGALSLPPGGAAAAAAAAAGPALPCELYEFQAHQEGVCRQLEDRLAAGWRRAFLEQLQDNLQGVYDVLQGNLAVYLASPLAKLLKHLELRMASQLRGLFDASLADWRAFVTRCTEPEWDAAQGQSPRDFVVTGRAPLFEVALVVDDADMRLQLRPAPEAMEAALLAALAGAAAALEGLPAVDAELLSLLRLEPRRIFDPRAADVQRQLRAEEDYIRERVQAACAGPRALLEAYEAYTGHLLTDPDELVEQVFDAPAAAAAAAAGGEGAAAGPPAVAEVVLKVREFHVAALEVRRLTHDQELFSLCRLDTTGAKASVAEKLLELRDALLDRVYEDARARALDVVTKYQAILERVAQKPKDEAELAALRDFIAQSKNQVAVLMAEVRALHQDLGLLDEFYHPMPLEDLNLCYETMTYPLAVEAACRAAEEALEVDKLKMMDKLHLEKGRFEELLETFEVDLARCKALANYDQMEANTDEVTRLQTALLEAKERAEDFNQREKVFGFPPTEYAVLLSVEQELDSYFKLWNMVSEFRASRGEWLDGPFQDLDAAEIEASVTDWWKTSYKLARTLEEETPEAAKCAQRLREETTAFREHFPVIKNLASKALKPRHWELLSDKMGVQIEVDEELTLKTLLDMRAAEFIDDIQDICVSAEKEYSLEQNLANMKEEWAPVEFEVKPYKSSFLVGGIDEIIALLDDHIVKTQTMRGSPFIKAIETTCKNWEARLKYAQQLLDEWIKCQRTWMYLEPIFGSEDIMRQLPAEARRFVAVDSTWKKTLAETNQDPRFLVQAEMDRNLLGKFRKANEMLDEIQKGLSDYLEMKRLYFPRFFFLSNDELLEILSQTKEPRAVQRHLGKAFEGINKVKFEDDLKITEMISAQGETVRLDGFVDPESSANKGNVERWLLELEAQQWQSIKTQTEQSLAGYLQKDRTQWALDWPAQVVLAVSQVYWTQRLTEKINGGVAGALEEELSSEEKMLMDIVQLVRGNLTKLQRSTLGALVVMDIHAKDVVNNLIQGRCKSTSDFLWMRELRYYWSPAWKDGQAVKKGQDTMVARIVNAKCLYGYEYLGNTMRLVITPLTDRCYRTMIGAVDLLYGGAPEGPAGTGKTETVKDLSKAVAIQCVVFNCSDGLDYLAMAKFFKGLAGCGSWCCFDEFNRINIEVLSVIAQQILTINEAKRQQQEKFHFEGTFMKLNQNCNCFITMNPGYAGRAELPDNLKALFRPCAMMVPDYALIGEIRLYSFGFERAKTNASKLVRVLQLSSEQLSSQKHYDYGMRAVNSILVAAGNLRQALGNQPEWTEEMIVLRSVNDVNLPKFTVEDLPLFYGITSDLFPGVELPKADHGALVPAIEKACLDGVRVAPGRTYRYDPVPGFTKKVVQLYEMVLVRHGVMIVGQTCSGKTSAIHTLATAMTKCNEQGAPFPKVQIHSMNPKSITSGQLYGNFDENTHEWSDGVLAVIYRNCAKDPSPDRQWVMFDGPVDAVWIENMNTVLDDNKKLCLMSGEIIKMSDEMTMMFEAEDLEQASPATVSRVGMIFCETRNLTWRPLRTIWLDQLSHPDVLEHKELLTYLFDWLFPPACYFVRKHCKIPTPVTEMEMAFSLCRLMSSFIDLPEGFASDVPKVLEGLFIMSLVWSVGACIDGAGRKLFSAYALAVLNNELEGNAYHLDFLSKHRDYADRLDPERVAATLPPGAAYDFRFDAKKAQWVPWIEPGFQFKVEKEATFAQIVVPTEDTVCNDWLIHQLLVNGYHVLATGDTGTGKSVSIKAKLLTGMGDTYQSIMLNFSAQTSSNQTQDIIDSKLEKRRKGVLGPPVNTNCVIFVDDLNMPAKEEYGAQPPIELLRQWMDHAGWYDREENEFQELVDIQFIAAMGPPGGGRSHITQRYIRHFNVLNFVPFSGESLKRIFGTICDWFLNKGFSGGVKQLSAGVVEATIDMYDTIAANLRATPMKSHYTFNLRDLSKVFQGMSLGNPGLIKDKDSFLRLWSHECMRVFHDRLIDSTDRKWFMDEIAAKVKDHFGAEYKKVRGPHEALIYGNFMDPKAVTAEQKIYQEVADRELLQKVMEDYLEDHNAMTTRPMSLVLFQNAIEHVARISRVINQPLGNALLVGVGGSGRKSLCTLAASIADFELFQIEISKSYGLNEWREDMKKIMKLAAVQYKPTVFLFDDTQIVMETFLEDLNGILNTGEVANLFNQEDIVEITEGMMAACQERGVNGAIWGELYPFFVERVRENLHVVVCMSPIGDSFRTRLRMFPALVNCCTIDWFTEWPPEALFSVARHFLDPIEMDQAVKEGVVDVCVDMQERVSAMSRLYLSEMGRHYYVTPTSYLELINTFKTLLHKKRQDVMGQQARYENGLTKIIETEAQVEVMQEELVALQPKLVEASVATEKLLKKIAEDSVEVNEKKAVVEVEEEKCSKQAAEANAMKESCEADLAEAMPALEKAVKALKNLKKSDLDEIKVMQRPPPGVKLTMEALCLMFGIKPDKVKDPDGGTKKIDDYWAPAKKDLLGNSKFLDELFNYDKDNIDERVIAKISKFVQMPDFQVEKVYKQSVAAAGLASWVHAMAVYDRVARVVAPKKAALAQAESDLKEAMEALGVQQKMLKEVLDKMAELERQLKEAEDKKESLKNQVQDCEDKLRRATQLISGLGGEKHRWGEFSKVLAVQYENVTGDIMLSSGVIAYLGAFTGPYREKALNQWSALLEAKHIPCSGDFSLTQTLGEPVLIREWVIAKLPNDSFSIDNAIMLFQSNRWPLMIDPQGQANKWIKMLETENLKVVKQNQASFIRTVENSVTYGFPVLLENIGETIDPVLEPVLLKQVASVGGVPMLKIGDNQVAYDQNFKLYITTKLRNPHYAPELCVKVNLLNFMATEEGLEDQMLGITVAKEQEALEAQREKLVLEDAENKRQLKEIEDKILHLLKTAEGNILDDEVLINTLAESKVTANLIEEKVKVATKTQETITRTRKGYIPVAFRVSQLFFCIADLGMIDPMYQYSLKWFIDLFEMSIDQAAGAASDPLETRLPNLKDSFTYILYKNVCRSLFEKDKLLFSFLLCTKIMLGDRTLDARELRYFLQGNTSMDLAKPNPLPGTWLSDKCWGDVLGLAELPAFAGFDADVARDLGFWERVFNSNDPAAMVDEKYGPPQPTEEDKKKKGKKKGKAAAAAAPAEGKYNLFQRLVVTRMMRPDMAVPQVLRFVSETMGQRFIEPPPFNLEECYRDSNCETPLIFVLTPGADPMSELIRLADKLGFAKKLKAISLGQGQGPLAEKAIQESADSGSWVCLQNCHLSVSWMPTLEKICEELTSDRVHDKFRLWLTSEPSPHFPAFILQNGVKMTNEPPKGMRANLQGSYYNISEDWLESCARPTEFKKLLFGLCFFHATVRERKKFGPLGWNIQYVFSGPDLTITKDQLFIFLNDLGEGEPVPYAALAYLAGECNYGGRVTDDKDRRCLVNILSDFYCDDIQSDAYKFSPSGTYFAPAEGELGAYRGYIAGLPFNEGPEVFGLHDNANISFAISETQQLLNTALSLQPRSSGGAEKSWDETLMELATDIAARIPDQYDIEKALLDFPVKYEESMNTVLTQELIRFNNLTGIITASLHEVKRAIQGLVVMSGELEAMGNSMVIGAVPAMWSGAAYPSLKPLGSWVTDFLERLQFLQDWMDKMESPSVYWVSGFFFTQAFITGTLQNFARKYQIPIDQAGFDFAVLTPEEVEAADTTKPEDGAYLRGLFLEGAGWSAEAHVVAESRPRELYVKMPYIHLLPKQLKDIEAVEGVPEHYTGRLDGRAHVYMCPVYKTSLRQGTLSTTGHSTNFVMYIRLPIAAEHQQKHWIKRGVAMLTQLDD